MNRPAWASASACGRHDRQRPLSASKVNAKLSARPDESVELDDIRSSAGAAIGSGSLLPCLEEQ
jgi:hypothetical protein